MSTSTTPHLTDEGRQWVLQTYKDLHAHPELSMQEHATADRIAAELTGLGVDSFRCGGTGVVAVVRNGEGPVVAFRADSDGLPIAEDTGLPYASHATGTMPDGTQVPVMHGCGHDVHVSSALGAVRVLTEHLDAWSGTVVFIFQPGEETAQGARALLDDGLWDKVPRPQVVLGQHVGPIPYKTVRITPGPAMAIADSLAITLVGKQSHGSQPQDSIDPVVLGAAVVQRLQGIVSREVDPHDSAVVTVGTFHAGLKDNIIPDRAELTVNVRTFRPEVREKVLAAIERIVRGEAAPPERPTRTSRPSAASLPASTTRLPSSGSAPRWPPSSARTRSRSAPLRWAARTSAPCGMRSECPGRSGSSVASHRTTLRRRSTTLPGSPRSPNPPSTARSGRPPLPCSPGSRCRLASRADRLSRSSRGCPTG